MKIWARWPYIHLSVVFPSRMPARTALCCKPMLLVKTFLIFDINHQQNTRRSDQIETIKTIMQTRALVSHGRFYQWLRLPFLKKYSIKSAKDLDCELFYSELKRHNVSHYIYYLATDNIHIVLENDNTVLIKGLKKVVNVKFSRNTHLIETSYDRLKSREITFQQYRENLAKAGVFRWVTNIHEHKRYYYTFDNSLLFTESIQNTTQIFPR